MKNKFIASVGSLVGILLALAPSGLAAPITDTATYSPGITIPDNNLNGVANTQIFSSAIQSITDVRVGLNISGGFDGDIYAYLTHGLSGFAVLLNRIGVSSSDIYGSYNSGFAVTLSDSAAADIHGSPANGGTLTGTWQPDGRNISPLNALDTTPRTALLDTFNGMDPNGDWTLFLADTSPVGVGTLNNWTLTVVGNTLPIPDSGNTLALFVVSGGVLIILNRRQLQSKA